MESLPKTTIPAGLLLALGGVPSSHSCNRDATLQGFFVNKNLLVFVLFCFESPFFFVIFILQRHTLTAYGHLKTRTGSQQKTQKVQV
jgi:hypothetical protein